MRKHGKAGLAAVIVFFGATATLAQSWTITIGPNNAVTSTLQQSQVNLVTQSQATVTVQCQTGVDCSQADLHLESHGATIADLGPPAQGASGATFTIPQSGVGASTDLVVLLGGNDIASFQVGSSSGPPPGDGTGDAPPLSDGSSLADLLALPCPGHYTAGYDEKKNEGQIVVTPLGVVLASGLDTRFDENDTLIVRVVADQRLLALLTVERTSAFRDVTSVQIVGAGETAPTLTRQAGLVAQCTERRFPLDNFAPGQGTVQISALQGTQLTPTGTFDFNVNPLYTGMLTLGAARTRIVDPGFKLAAVDGQTVIAAGEEGDEDLIYTLFYTPFVWGKRDLQKRVPWYRHFNPSLGIAPQDITDNAFAGITADLPAGIALTFGWHFRQVETLTQGLAAGMPFAGSADQLPTAEEWESDHFLALSIDLRAMVQLFQAALGGGTGAGGGS
jgi:hypothetical protein